MIASSRTSLSQVFSLEDSLSREDAGGKAAGLARLRQAGCSVPEGFVVSSQASRLNPQTRQAIRAAYRRMGRGPVAVRSSGELEDSGATSQAGMFTSLLNVSGEAALLAAVEAVFADGIRSVGPGRGAVVVQRMLAAEASGVLFTRSPESPDEMLIESSWGIGVSASGGSVDRIRVSRRDRSLWIELARKQDMTVPHGGAGVKQEPCSPDQVDAPSLSEAAAQALAELGLRLEAELGGPLDLEWALERGVIHLVQARPIVAPDGWDAPPAARPFDLWSRHHVAELFPDPVTPLTLTVCSDHWSDLRRDHFRMFGLPGLDRVGFFRLHDSRLYFNVGAFYHFRFEGLGRGRPILGPHALAAHPPEQHGVRPPASRPLLIARRLPGLVRSTLVSYRRRRLADSAFAEAARIALRYRVLSTDVSAAELFDRFEDLWAEIRRLGRYERVADDSVYNAGRFLEFCCDRWLGEGELLRELVPGADSSSPTAIAPELVALAAAASDTVRRLLQKETPTDLEPLRRLDPEYAAQIDDFLNRHGHRTRGELELSQPRWIEDPAPVLAALKACLIGGARPLSRRPALDPMRAEAAARARLRPLPMERWLPIRRLIFGIALGRARRLLPYRSVPRDRTMLMYLELRRIVIALGGQLLARGHLRTAEDVFMLTRDELEALIREDAGRQAQVQVTVQRRRLQLGRAAQRSVPDIIGADGRPLEMESPAQLPPAGTRAILTGRGAVPGTVEGPVRLIQAPSDYGWVRLGEVLVLASAEISSTLLFPLAAAIVDERGSLLSHATVLAREYGLPTVVEVTGAARRLHNGDMVRVDGEAGSVEILRRNGRGRG